MGAEPEAGTIRFTAWFMQLISKIIIFGPQTSEYYYFIKSHIMRYVWLGQPDNNNDDKGSGSQSSKLPTGSGSGPLIMPLHKSYCLCTQPDPTRPAPYIYVCP